MSDAHQSPARTAPHRLLRLRYMVLTGLIVAILCPMLTRQVTTGIALTQPTQYNTALGGCIALLLGVLGYRRMHVFPGIAAGGYVVMSLTAMFGFLAVAFFMMRIDYSRVQFLSSYVLSVLVYLAIHQKVTVARRLRLGVVPSARTQKLPDFPTVDWVHLTPANDSPAGDVDAIVADLHGEHDAAWDAQITRFVLNGIPVYHFRQALEQISGRVEIHHLSENTLGSLNPNDVYLKIKAVVDGVAAAVLLALLCPVIAFTCLLVRLDSPGPALFRQRRTGHRGRSFTVYKIRTMRTGAQPTAGSDDQMRQAAMTKVDDPRITRLGGFLRRSRLDELPQLFNIVKGEMSLIGPRPEAEALSRWYEKEIPFYHYRHLIRPGVTGWAQINQGHVTDVADVQEKLHLDFYYVKNFSFWLDLLIAVRTARTMITGHGAR
ncbi:sugar transferase [Sphingomonas sp. RHCKR7]|uniref:sugar transferase n=1 Tax=Sphingomonas folli TaxID=2862497 RepID=UPI001CA4CC91|nr:sugar transferase [Sphingomonas folli]MBW6526753.1 sugar transferase [Sphingomonas folli]